MGLPVNYSELISTSRKCFKLEDHAEEEKAGKGLHLKKKNFMNFLFPTMSKAMTKLHSFHHTCLLHCKLVVNIT